MLRHVPFRLLRKISRLSLWSSRIDSQLRHVNWRMHCFADIASIFPDSGTSGAKESKCPFFQSPNWFTSKRITGSCNSSCVSSRNNGPQLRRKSLKNAKRFTRTFYNRNGLVELQDHYPVYFPTSSLRLRFSRGLRLQEIGAPGLCCTQKCHCLRVLWSRTMLIACWRY